MNDTTGLVLYNEWDMNPKKLLGTLDLRLFNFLLCLFCLLTTGFFRNARKH